MAIRHRAKVGRPTSYNDKIAEKICSLIAEGNSLRSICKRNEMPDKATIIRWLGVHLEFSDQYAHAREAQADKLFEECLEIADDTSGDFIEKKNDDGSTFWAIDHEHIQRSKLRIDTRKWMAGKLAPKKYGEKVAQEIGGSDGGPIVIVTGVPRAGEAMAGAPTGGTRSRVSSRFPAPGTQSPWHPANR
jgi:hypothetical protein